MEEKKTLIQEGFPVPTKLPLVREEEEALKIVRRKIKNKVGILKFFLFFKFDFNLTVERTRKQTQEKGVHGYVREESTCLFCR